MSAILLILAIKAALWFTSRALLPFLFGQARGASLQLPSAAASSSTSGLPQPVTTASSAASTHTLYDLDRNGVDDDDLHTSTEATSFLSRAARSRSLKEARDTILAAARPHGYNGLNLAGFAAFLFSLAFQETATLYVAVLLEAAGFDTSDYSALRGAFKASIILVIQLAVVLIPLGICLLLTYRSNSSTPLSRRLVYLALPFIPWLALFFSVPLPSAITVPESRSGVTDRLLARTAVIGVTLIALLSGSAAMAAAWEAVEQWRGKSTRPPTQSDIALAHESFRRACSDLESKKSELQRLEKELDAARTDGSGGGGRWSLSKLWVGDARSREIKTLKAEISALGAVASAMREDLDTMIAMEKRQRRSKTLSGRLMTAVLWGWAVYCGFRVALSVLNLVILGYHDTSSPPDFISLALASVLRLVNVEVDVQAWTKQISLVFIGLLIWVRIGSVLRWLGRTFQAASRGIETCFLVLFLSEVMTIYLLATLIQLRTSLPPSHTVHPPLLALLPNFQVVFGALFDSGFLVAASATAGYKYLGTWKRQQGVLFGPNA
ncbi:hypothetical protein ACQY0O_002275 [Thecaphora frezii]